MWDKWPWFNREPERHERPGKKAMGLRIGELGTIEIGVQGECDAREIVLDVTEWLEVWPDAVFLITHRRPTEYAAYNVANTEIRDGGALVWTVSAEDVAIAGRGEIQVRAYEGDTLVKSISGRTVIRPGVGAGEEPAEATDWLEKVSKAGAEATKGAEDAATIAERLAQILYGALENDVFTGTQEEWEEFLDSLVKSLDAARDAAREAQENANEVQGYIQEARDFRDEYEDDLRSLAVLLRSIRHTTTEEPDGWVELDQTGLENLDSFPTVDQLVQMKDALQAAITAANAKTTEMQSKLTEIENKLQNGEFNGADGARGPAGRNGVDGKDGFVVRGTYPTVAALEAGVPNPTAGMAYGVGENGNYTVYIYDGVKGEWVSWGSLTGGTSGISEDDFNTLFDNRLNGIIDRTLSTAEAGTTEKALYDKILSLVGDQLGAAFDARINQIRADTTGNADATKAFRQAVYDTMFPVGYSFCTSYRDTRLTAYREDHPDVIEWNPTTMATALGVTATWQRKYDSLMGYINGAPKYAVGLVRFYRTA